MYTLWKKLQRDNMTMSCVQSFHGTVVIQTDALHQQKSQSNISIDFEIIFPICSSVLVWVHHLASCSPASRRLFQSVWCSSNIFHVELFLRVDWQQLLHLHQSHPPVLQFPGLGPFLLTPTTLWLAWLFFSPEGLGWPAIKTWGQLNLWPLTSDLTEGRIDTECWGCWGRVHFNGLALKRTLVCNCLCVHSPSKKLVIFGNSCHWAPTRLKIKNVICRQKLIH